MLKPMSWQRDASLTREVTTYFGLVSKKSNVKAQSTWTYATVCFPDLTTKKSAVFTCESCGSLWILICLLFLFLVVRALSHPFLCHAGIWKLVVTNRPWTSFMCRKKDRKLRSFFNFKSCNHLSCLSEGRIQTQVIVWGKCKDNPGRVWGTGLRWGGRCRCWFRSILFFYFLKKKAVCTLAVYRTRSTVMSPEMVTKCWCSCPDNWK